MLVCPEKDQARFRSEVQIRLRPGHDGLHLVSDCGHDNGSHNRTVQVALCLFDLNK